MRIVVAGGHGQIAMLLHPLLNARGHDVRGLIRNPDHADDVRQAGATPVVCDLEAEDDVAKASRPADAIVTSGVHVIAEAIASAVDGGMGCGK